MAHSWNKSTHARLQVYSLGAVDCYKLALRRLQQVAGDLYVLVSRWYMHTIHPYRGGIQGTAYSLVLASIPIIMVGIVIIHKPIQQQPLAAVVVSTEGVTALKQDYNTFNNRWLPTINLPPATVIHEVQVTTSTLPPVSEVQQPLPQSRRPHPAAPSARRGDICSRHGMKRVNYGRTWRCRR
jgi:hypothetical protein